MPTTPQPLGGARNKGGCHCSATPEVGGSQRVEGGRRARGSGALQTLTATSL